MASTLKDNPSEALRSTFGLSFRVDAFYFEGDEVAMNLELGDESDVPRHSANQQPAKVTAAWRKSSCPASVICKYHRPRPDALQIVLLSPSS